jgi:hypothetical protein
MPGQGAGAIGRIIKAANHEEQHSKGKVNR